jgi:hypothetical protein
MWQTLGPNRSRALRKHRGIALVIVLSMVVLVAFAVAFAITMSGKDTRDNAKQIHNLTIQNVAEGSMQQARAFFSTNMLIWNTYLAVPNPPDKVAHPELYPTVPAGFSCYMYARDDADELPPAVNNPLRDNNQTIYIGSVCTGPGNTTAELTGVLTFDNSRFKYTSATPSN